jgi:predicted adenylyl cyclase CyaB
MRNIEVKAASPDLTRARRVLRASGFTRETRPLDQIDWYFTVPSGRLKLRRRTGESGAELILYVRPDARQARSSEYQKLPVADAPHALRLLRVMFPAGPCVRKRRELWLRQGTRVHLDLVRGLGRFIEIEVPVTGSAAKARAVMRELVAVLGIAPASTIGESYSDLLARRR